jgi:hypothetical protein
MFVLARATKIKESEERFRSMFQYHPDAVLAFDRTGMVALRRERCQCLRLVRSAHRGRDGARRRRRWLGRVLHLGRRQFVQSRQFTRVETPNSTRGSTCAPTLPLTQTTTLTTSHASEAAAAHDAH